MIRLIAILLFLFGLGITPASAGDCDGIYGAGQICGSNAGGAPGPISISGFAGSPVNVMAAPYNAKCDGVTDDTGAITAAIAATPSGGTLVLPNGFSCLVSGSGSAIFTLTNPINIIGWGMTEGANETGSSLILASSVPTTRDVFHIVGITNQTLAGFTFRNFNVIAISVSGRYVLHFDSTTGTTTNFASILVDNVFFEATASAGGYSIFLDNGTGTNTNGGAYTVTISNSFLGGGINTSKTGDSIRVINNLISTANAGIILDQVAGAGGFYAAGNNVSGAAGCFIVTQAIKPVWGGSNECEQQVTNTEANNAIIDIVASGMVSGALISGGQVQANTGTGNPTLIRNAGADTVIENMRLATPASYAHIVNAAAAARLVLGANNAFSGGGANLTDSGSGTILMPKSLGTALSIVGNAGASTAVPADVTATNINQVPVVNAAGNAWSWGQVQLAGGANAGIVGMLPYGNGGTNAATLAGLQANIEQSEIKIQVTGVNFNSIADTAFPFTLPAGFTRAYLGLSTISNAGHTLTTAQFGVFTATAAGGQVLIAGGTAITVSATADQTANNMMQLAGSSTLSFVAASLATPNTIYFRVTNAEGVAATADVALTLRLLP